MSTIPWNHPDVQHTDGDHLMTLALCAASKRALAAYPDNSRVIAGIQLALARKVTMLDNGSAEVASQFGTCTYSVNGTCPCPDTQHRRTILCKHRWAVAIWEKALTILAKAGEEYTHDGTRCPQCGHDSVQVERWGRSEQCHDWRICRFAWRFGELEVVECPWRERIN